MNLSSEERKEKGREALEFVVHEKMQLLKVIKL